MSDGLRFFELRHSFAELLLACFQFVDSVEQFLHLSRVYRNGRLRLLGIERTRDE
jgi:hypothetical protein